LSLKNVLALGNRAAKMQFLPLVGNAFLQDLEQPISKTLPGLAFLCFWKKVASNWNIILQINHVLCVSE
jgi:hypothetical protein